MDLNSQLVRYVGDEVANTDYHDGQLRPVVGVQNIQVLRANRSHPEWVDDLGCTYNHAPMLAYWNGRFYLEYLNGPVSERDEPGRTMVMTSEDGLHWEKPVVAFPAYPIPDGIYRPPEDYTLAPGSYAVMHQRMGFYVAPDGRLLVLGFYGPCPQRPDGKRTGPNDGRGIGRVVREIYPDGDFGPIYFIRYNRHAGWNESNTSYPFYKEADDAGFVAACDALLADKLMTLQWWEDDRSPEGFYTLEGYKALSYYHLPDGRVVGLWKWSKAAISEDEGHTWSPVQDVPSLVNCSNKIWGQRTSDGRYALVYTPSRDGGHRWPLALVTGGDGISFDKLRTVAGDVSPRRFWGNTKDFGLNYVRGIVEGNGNPPDGAMWLTYSVNKEDIWVCRVSVPIRDCVDEPVHDTFNDMQTGGVISGWNIYSPVWCPVSVVEFPSPADKSLKLQDQDPYDYAKAERAIPESVKVSVNFKIMARQSDFGELHIELAGTRGNVPVRLFLTPDGWIKARDGHHLRYLMEYEPNTWYAMSLTADCATNEYTLSIGEDFIFRGGYKWGNGAYFTAPVHTVERLVFRTGPRRREPTLDSDRDRRGDLPQPDEPISRAMYYVNYVTTTEHEFED